MPLSDEQIRILRKSRTADDAQEEAYRLGLLRAAEIADERRREVDARIAGGKGEWPKPGYVKDDTWHDWHGQRFAAGVIVDAIRREAGEGSDAPD